MRKNGLKIFTLLAVFLLMSVTFHGTESKLVLNPYYSMAGATAQSPTSRIRLLDTDYSHYLALMWDENRAANQTLNFITGAGDRTVTLSGNLTVESASLVNQDLTTDAAVTFATIDTGQGANDLWDMNQNVTTTSNVTFGDITAGHLGLGGASPNADYGISYDKVLTDTDNSVKHGVYSILQVKKTAAAMTSHASSLKGLCKLDSTNTQNWTDLLGLHGVYGGIITEGGSSGTITGAANYITYASIADAATVTNLYGLYMLPPSVAGNKVTNEYGLYIGNQNTGATLNYAIYTNAGLVHFGDSLDVSGNVTVGDGDWIGNGAAKPRILFDDTNSDIEMRGGDVGVGTNNPEVQLDVVGVDTEQVLQVRSASGVFGIKPWVVANGGSYLRALNSAQSEYVTMTFEGSSYIFNQGSLFINETANAKMTTGLTINQGAADDEIIALKSSDVAHGMTTLAETDTYGTLKKQYGTGLGITGYGEHATGTYGLSLSGISSNDNTTKDAGASAPIQIMASNKSGTTHAAVGADGNLLTIENYGSARFIFDEDGDMYYDGAAPANYDAFDDAAACFDVQRVLYNIDKPKERQLMDFKKYTASELIDMGVISDGGFVSTKRMNALILGAVGQLDDEGKAQAQRIDELESQVTQLQAMVEAQAQQLQAALALLTSRQERVQ